MSRVYNWPVRGLLLSDQGDRDHANSGRIDMLRDLDGDGAYRSAGERQSFFGYGDAGGLVGEELNIFSMAQGADGHVYVGDGESDTVYRLRDLNGDGDAMDAGEAQIWFSESGNAAAHTLPTPNGLAFGPDGALYVVNAGNIGSRPLDAIYRTQDLNGDGDANDPGEAVIWADLSLANPDSSAFDIAFIGAAAYVMDLNGFDPDTIYRIEDKDGSGDISGDEITVFAGENSVIGGEHADESGLIGDKFGFSIAAQGDSILSFEGLNFSTGDKLWRLTDKDGSGEIDRADEFEMVWDASKMPEGFSMDIGFSVATSADGDVALTSNGFTDTSSLVAVLHDLNGDGDYLDAGETAVPGSAADGGYLRPRAVMFHEGEVQPSTVLASAGNHFSIFLDQATNTVYATGENVKGQLGNGAFGFSIKAALPVSTPEGFAETIVSVAAGMTHGSFLTASGDVYTWGQGNFGRLGHGDQTDLSVATRIAGALDDKTVMVLDHGNGASYAITSDGALYAWGHNASGQLGLGDETRRLEPTQVTALAGEKIVAISGGTSHTLALTDSGEVYAWGSARRGQLGSPEALDAEGAPLREVLSPVKVAGLPEGVRVSAITADGMCSYAVLEDGRVFGWGENRYGQMLRGENAGDGTFAPDAAHVLAPVEITGLPADVVDVKGGARWAVALTGSGDVYAWGPNDQGPTGGLDGDIDLRGETSFYPVRIAALDAVNIVDIQTGPNSILATAEDGSVYGWGLNSEGRLGFMSDGVAIEPTMIEFGGDAAPWLLSATPGDNARGVSAAATFELTFTEDVHVGTGRIYLVNRDSGARIEIDAADASQLSVSGAKVVVDPAMLLDRDARYALQIDQGAFRDASGQDYAGIALDDEKSFNFTTAALSELAGTGGRDRLVGGEDDERIVSGAGSLDRTTGGAGADVFVFGAETANGARERDIIADYTAGEDSIDLGGAEIRSVRETGSYVLLTIGEDRDMVMLRGVSDFSDIRFVDDDALIL